MKKLLPLLALFTHFSCTFLYAHIHTIDTLHEITQYLNPDRKQIVVFDIDNTLLCPPTDLGSAQWINHLIKQYMLQGLNYGAAHDHALPLYFHVNHHIELIPTEDNLSKTIQTIEQQCAHTICLTARSGCLITKTIEQLTKNNLQFNVPEINHQKLTLPSGSTYQDGVLFCGPNCKGKILRIFLNAIHFSPDDIIFIDDKEHYLLDVENQLENTPITFIGLRYTGCDNSVANFNSAKAEQELAELLAKHPLISYEI